MRGQAGSFAEYDIASGELLYESVDNAPARNNLIANNRIIGDGIIGVELFEACSNTFVGNNFKGEDVSAVLFQRIEEESEWGPSRYIQQFGGTGANTFVGSATIVEENPVPGVPLAGDGYFDCDGDGIGDPNVYMKGSKPVNGLGTYVSAAISQSGRPGEL
jgi:hypothetical protein